MGFRAAAKHLISGIFPHFCYLCGDKTEQRYNICSGCETDLPFAESYCQCCGSSLEQSMAHCGHCLATDPVYDNTLVLFDYGFPIAKLLTQLKFQRQFMPVPILTKLMLQAIEAHYANTAYPEVIIPVPLHPRRVRQRGYNQALELAKRLSKSLQLPLNKQCIRQRYTKPQTSLAPKERTKNVQQAFQVKGTMQASHVAIVDDVMTTGSTVNELSRALKSAGVDIVDVWVYARA